jgi:hypothetical protein
MTLSMHCLFEGTPTRTGPVRLLLAQEKSDSYGKSDVPSRTKPDFEGEGYPFSPGASSPREMRQEPQGIVVDEVAFEKPFRQFGSLRSGFLQMCPFGSDRLMLVIVASFCFVSDA